MTDRRGSDRQDLGQSDLGQSDLAQASADNPDTDRFAAQTPPVPSVPEQAGPPPEPTPTPPAAQVSQQHYQKVRRTKFSGLWIGITVAAIVLLVLLVFIIENSQTVDVGFFGAHWHLSLGVAMLLAAIGGILLVAIPGYGRIIQLRRVLRKATKPAPGQPANPKNQSR